MKHFYQNISGMFRPEQKLCYKNQITQAKENSHFVELGIWKGRSASFMAVEIINSGKKIKYDVVDTWLGTPSLGTKEYSRSPFVKNGTLYEHFLDNVKSVRHIINPIRMTTVEASKLYDNNSLDFVFIDASHDYDSVKEDIKHWLPKIRENGILAGDDMEWHLGDGVKRAVNELLPKHIQDRNTWLYRK